jgi:hypothetical protein
VLPPLRREWVRVGAVDPSQDTQLDSGFGPVVAAGVRLIVITLAMIVGWVLCLALSVGLASAFAKLFSASGDVGPGMFLVVLVATPVGLAAGAAAGTWLLLRGVPRKRRMRRAVAPFFVTLVAFALVAVLGVPNAETWWFTTAAGVGAVAAVWVTGSSTRDA